MAITTVGMDLGKNTMHLAGLDERGAIVERHRVTGRTALFRYLANCNACRVAMGGTCRRPLHWAQGGIARL